ncbi:MAG: hypothetical protein IPO62_07070 [Saprospiraceae bacterium]|nr:hypothetical protein [Saprospiraceae bacterium]
MNFIKNRSRVVKKNKAAITKTGCNNKRRDISGLEQVPKNKVKAKPKRINLIHHSVNI